MGDKYDDLWAKIISSRVDTHDTHVDWKPVWLSPYEFIYEEEEEPEPPWYKEYIVSPQLYADVGICKDAEKPIVKIANWCVEQLSTSSAVALDGDWEKMILGGSKNVQVQ